MATPTERFTSLSLDNKLRDLNSTMQSIQGVSQWLIYHKKHAKTIVGVWFREIQKAKPNRKLTLLYLANDVIQNSKRKGQEFKMEFQKALPRALHFVAKGKKDDSFIKSVIRIINVWDERHVFDSETLDKFKSILSSPSSLTSSRRSKSDSDVKTLSPEIEMDTPPSPQPLQKPPNNKEVLEPDALLAMIRSVDGGNSSVEDMSTRQKIANFPTELYNANISENVTDLEKGKELLEKVEEALKILSEYTTAMKEEEKKRADIDEYLDTFIWNQQKQFHSAKMKQKEYQQKTERCGTVREVLKSHIAALPNLATPTSEGLTPLPSAGDLFS